MEGRNLGNPRRRIVAILGGPTGSGKTALAVELCRLRGWEVLSADSGQSRRGFRIGTAAPTPGEIRAVPHHLCGDLEPAADDSLAAYLDRAEAVLRRPGPDLLAVGGTGQYLSGVLHGLDPAPPPDPVLRARLADRLEREGASALLAELASLAVPPPDAASNPVRLLRALEKALLRARGVPERGCAPLAPGAPVLALGLPRPALHERLERRLDAMLETGWREEVRALTDSVPPEAPAWKAIGYAELRSDPACGPETRGRILEATRQYAKRQETWLRHLSPVWIDGSLPLARQVETALSAIGSVP